MIKPQQFVPYFVQNTDSQNSKRKTKLIKDSANKFDEMTRRKYE